MMLYLITIADPVTEVIPALSKTLRIPVERFYNETSLEELQVKDDYFIQNQENLDNRNLKVSIVIAPNATNDFPAPMFYCSQMD
jgi:hypothetical protein